MVDTSKSRKVKPSLLKKLISISELGNIKKEIHSFHTSYITSNDIGNLHINFADGRSELGDGHIIVHSKGKLVLRADVSYDDKEGVRVITPPLNVSRSFLVEEYIPGAWEEQVREYRIPRKR